MEKQDQSNEVFLNIILGVALIAVVGMASLISWISVYAIQVAVELEGAPAGIRALLAFVGIAGCVFGLWVYLNLSLACVVFFAKSVDKKAYRVIRWEILRSPRVMFGPIQRALRKNN
jgi:hypothetical protein